MFDLKDQSRRVATKRFNERVKLSANVLNGMSAVTFGAAVVVPAVGGSPTWTMALWILVAIALHFAAQAVLGLLRDED